jgi:hypothetical protein
LLLLPGLLGTLSLLLLRPLLLSRLLLHLRLLSPLLAGLLGTLSLLLWLTLLDPPLLGLLLHLRLLSPLLPGLLGTLSLLLWLSLLNPLLGLLSGLSVLLLLRLPLLLFACLWSLRLFLRALLLCGWRRTFLLPALMLFRLALLFVMLVVLRVRRDNRSAKQKHGGGTGSSNELHSNHLRYGRYPVCTQTTSPP